MMAAARKLRDLLDGNRMVVAPGCFDAIGARAIARHGFAAAYMSGGAVAGALGFPDYGLTTMTEMVDSAARIAAAVDIPLISDADTGFGNELNVVRTVRDFELRGIAAIHLEDQEFPKRCGHLEGKRLIPSEDFVRKIAAAAEARRTPDFVIIARTDARGVTGFDDAIARANAAVRAGADAVFVEAPQSVEEILAIPKLVDAPCVLNVLGRGKTPELPIDQVEAAGYKIAILPALLLRGYFVACDEALKAFSRTGTYPQLPEDLEPKEIVARMGANDWSRWL